MKTNDAETVKRNAIAWSKMNREEMMLRGIDGDAAKFVRKSMLWILGVDKPPKGGAK